MKIKDTSEIGTELNEQPNMIKMRVDELIKQGEAIGKEEFHDASDGFPFSYVSGDKFDSWMEEINILNERYLKNHPSYESIHGLYNKRNKNPNSYKRMLSQLKVISKDEDFWLNFKNNVKGIEEESFMKKNVFVVHGHDEGATMTVARFLENIGLNPIILDEKADGGRTIIEKIEHYTDVDYAIILYTPCDVGKAKDESEYKKRARQNVVFEHGYLIGKLGRERVCALVKDNVETPGDIDGIVYKNMDPNKGWIQEIIKEMKNVGFEIDANKIL